MFDIGGVFSPIRGVIWGVGSVVVTPLRTITLEARQLTRILFSLSDYKKSQTQVYEENRRLEARVAELESMAKENELLREELELNKRSEYELEMATVVGFSDSGAGEWIVINKGSSSGFAIGMPVFAHSSVLIGSIEEVFPSTARVRLLSSGESVVNVRIANTRVKGVVRGRYGLGLQLDMILSTDPLTEGDRVVTSEIGQRFEEDLFIGIIRDVRMSEDGLSRQAVVDQGVSLYDIGVVGVAKEL